MEVVPGRADSSLQALAQRPCGVEEVVRELRGT